MELELNPQAHCRNPVAEFLSWLFGLGMRLTGTPAREAQSTGSGDEYGPKPEGGLSLPCNPLEAPASFAIQPLSLEQLFKLATKNGEKTVQISAASGQEWMDEAKRIAEREGITLIIQSARWEPYQPYPTFERPLSHLNYIQGLRSCPRSARNLAPRPPLAIVVPLRN